MTDDLYRAAKALMDSVTHDMIGIDGRGGNGGLVSTATIRRSDELRQVLPRYKPLPTGPLPPDVIAAAWGAWHSRHGGKLGPGPAFVEAIEAAILKLKETNRDR